MSHNAHSDHEPHDDNGQFRIDDPSAIVDGKSIAQWTQDWWTWAMQSDADRNPSNDPTGAFASRHNHGDVFFIGGVPLVANTANVSESAERNFRVPHDTPLLVPLINAFSTLEDQADENQELVQFLSSVKPNSLFLNIDGRPVDNLQSFKEVTDFFSLGLGRKGTAIEEFAQSVGTSVVGQELTPTKAAGYYVMVEGLGRGPHTLNFGAATTNGFSVHVVDHIIVG